MECRFSEFLAHIKDPAVLRAYSLLLSRISWICVRHHNRAREITAQGQQEIIRVNTRKFIAAYLIVYFPTHVLETSNGEQERNVITAATRFVRLFDEIVENMPSGSMSPSSIQSDRALAFLESAETFFAVYHAWEAIDKQVLAGRIQRCILSLINARNRINAVDFNTGIQILKTKLDVFAGKVAADEFMAQHQVAVAAVVPAPPADAIPPPNDNEA
jgi:hypothetical protein